MNPRGSPGVERSGSQGGIRAARKARPENWERGCAIWHQLLEDVFVVGKKTCNAGRWRTVLGAYEDWVRVMWQFVTCDDDMTMA